MNRQTTLWAILWLLGAGWAKPLAGAETVVVATAAAEGQSEHQAVRELAMYLGKLHPQTTFTVAAQVPAAGPAIVAGSGAMARGLIPGGDWSKPESYQVRTIRRDHREIGVIAGADPRGTWFGVYALLRQLGCAFTLSGDALPGLPAEPFSFAGWDLADAPLVRERLVFNWHNFLSGCSTWNLPEWRQWTAQAQKQGFNAIMVHAYGNNPMAAFDFAGRARPVGWLSTTIQGRDWSTMHVNDVRRLHGGWVFESGAFGAAAGLAPDGERVAAARSLMREVFADAAARSLNVYFAVDVDTPSANPQELIRLLPESARFEAGGSTATMTDRQPGRIWLPNPDTPEGYAFHRAQVAILLQEYPQITRLVAWFRRDGTPWMNLKVAGLPGAWQREYAAEIARTPEAGQYWRGPGLFAIGKIARAFGRALKETGATGVTLAAGTWGFEFLPGADRFFPAGIPLIGLDYDVIHGRPQLGEAAARAPLRAIGARRPVIPVVWAHHDDGHYLGRPYTPLAGFASRLEDARAAGFGIIHWTTRPLDLYFASLASQVWGRTRDQALAETCRALAGAWFGRRPGNPELLGNYLESWITGAPQFGRETSDWFIDRQLTDIPAILAGGRARLALLGQARTDAFSADQRQRFDYQRQLEEFTMAFHAAHGQFQASQDLLRRGDREGARRALADCHPEAVIGQYARLSSLGGLTRGEQGVIVSLNTRWLSHIERHRQALGLRPVRLNFAPTSHDPLAQSRGLFTFHFGPGHELWECLGAEETGAAVFTLPPALEPALPPAAPAGWSGICRTGIESAQPLTFGLRPILYRNPRENDPAAQLPPGDYRLRLLLLDPRSTAPGQRVFQVSVAGRCVARAVDIFEEAGGANRLLVREFPVTVGASGTVAVTLTPSAGQAALCGAILEPKP